MRILFATKKKHVPQVFGGSQSSTHDLCCALIDKGHSCAVMSELKPGDWLWLRNRIESKLSRRKFLPDRAAGYTVFRGWDVEQHAASVAEQFKPDIVIVQAGQPILLANRFLEAGYKTIVYARDVEFDRYGGQPIKGKPLYFIANSEFTAGRIKDHFGYDAVAIPPLVRQENYKTQSSREYVLFINPAPEKGADLALQLARDNPDIPFLFVETWEIDYSKCREAAEGLANVRWLQKQSDMKSVYKQAKVVLSPSRWDEAWCRVVSEAQISGIPALSSDRGGLPESVGPGGILLPYDAPVADWTQALRSLCFDTERYTALANLAREHSERKGFQPQVLLDKLVKTLESAVYSGTS